LEKRGLQKEITIPFPENLHPGIAPSAQIFIQPGALPQGSIRPLTRMPAPPDNPDPKKLDHAAREKVNPYQKSQMQNPTGFNNTRCRYLD
jgi:hypothetical protein